MSILKSVLIFNILFIVSLHAVSKGKKDFYTDLITVYYAIEPHEIITPEVLSKIRLTKIPAVKISFKVDAADNKKLLSSDEDGIKIYDYSDDSLLFSVDVKGKKRVLADDDKVVVATENGSIKIIDTLTGEIEHTLEKSEYKELPYLTVYSGKVFASAYGDKSIKVWDIYSGKNIETLLCKEGVKGLLAQNGKLVAIFDKEGFDIKTWDIQTDAMVKSPDDLNATWKTSSDTFSYDAYGKVLPLYGDGLDNFITNSDISTKKWNMHTRELLSELPHAKNGLAANETDTIIITEERDILVNGEKYIFANKENISNIFVSDDRFYVVFDNETYILDPDVMAANKRKNDLMKQFAQNEDHVASKSMGERIRFALDKNIIYPYEIAIDDYFKHGVRDIIKDTMTSEATSQGTKNKMTEKIIAYIKNNFISEKTVYLLSFMSFDKEKKDDLSASLSEVLKNRFLTKDEYETVKQVIAYIPTLFFFHNK